MNKLVILFLLVSFGLYGQGIEPSSLQPTPYKGGIMVGVIQSIDEFTGDTLYMYQHSDKSSSAKVKNSPTMTLRIQNDSIRADIKKRLNAINAGGADVFLGLNIDTTGQITGVAQIISDDFDKDPYNEFQSLTIDSLNRVFKITLSDGGMVKFMDRGATQYLNPYIVSTDTIGFYITVAQDTVVFQGSASSVIGESTTVGDTPTIDMTLTGTNITANVIDGSITAAKLSQTYITTEVDGSITNELQTISTTGAAGNITLSNGGNTLNLNVNDADSNPNNEIQDLSLSGQTLSLTSDATSVTLPIIDVVAGTNVTVTKSGGVATINTTGGGSAIDYAQIVNTSSDVILVDPTTEKQITFNSNIDNNGAVNGSGSVITLSAIGVYEISYKVSLDPILNTTFQIYTKVGSTIQNASYSYIFTTSSRYTSAGASFLFNKTTSTSENITLFISSSTNIYGCTISSPVLLIKKIN